MIYRFLDAADARNRNIIGDVEVLLAQLSGHRIEISSEFFSEVASRNVWAAAVEEGSGAIVGMATLVPVRIPTGSQGRIEDVVVKDGLRGKGIGRKLMEVLIAEARRLKMGRVTLTSKPERKAANHLYQDLGFEQHITNVYRLVLSP